MNKEYDLIRKLRLAAQFAGPNSRELYLDAAVEIERCHRRLEIDHYYVQRGNERIRVAIPYSERVKFPDAVTCRDATIEFAEQNAPETET